MRGGEQVARQVKQSCQQTFVNVLAKMQQLLFFSSKRQNKDKLKRHSPNRFAHLIFSMLESLVHKKKKKLGNPIFHPPPPKKKMGGGGM